MAFLRAKGDSGMKLTEEQRMVVSAVRSGESVKIAAFAGTGKTTTLRAVAYLALQGKRVLYLAFNRSTAEEARGKFTDNVEVRTAHSLAFRAVGRAYQGRIARSLLACRRDASSLCQKELSDVCQVGGRSSWQAHAAVSQTLQGWLQSDDTAVGPQHVPAVVAEACTRLGWREALADAARAYWRQMEGPRGRLPVTHDVYLKAWRLSQPVLPYDVILWDEVQDANPVMLGLVRGQEAQQVLVGDTHQQLYAFRGAVDAMRQVRLRELPLTQSWRFGPQIAAAANRVLDLIGEGRRLTGMAAPGQVLQGAQQADVRAVLGRTNGGLVAEALALLDHQRTIAVVGGVEEMVRLLLALHELRTTGSSSHAELAVFANWAELEEVAQTPIGAAFRPLVDLVKKHKGEIPKMAERLRREAKPDEADAEVVLSTVHKAKGREWPSVRLLDDFPAPLRGDPEHLEWDEDELNVQYVAQTRAQQLLHLSGNGQVLRDAAAIMGASRAG